MATNPYSNPRPTWEEVINPLADSTLWPFIRRAASLILEKRYEGTGFGISSSDVNHTVFGIAAWIDRDAPDYPGKVLTALVHEGAEI